MRLLVLAALPLLATACATHDRGWTGSNAVPFDTAEHDCTVATATMADAALRRQAFAECMADKGWSRRD